MTLPSIRKTALHAAALGLAAAFAALPATAALYKWVDANGRVVYSDQPPTADVKTERVGPAPPPSNPNAVKEMVDREAEFKKRQLDRAEDAKKAEKARAESQKHVALCTQARSQIAGLNSMDTAMFRVNEKGQRVLLDGEARRAEVEKLEQLVRDRKCPPA